MGYDITVNHLFQKHKVCVLVPTYNNAATLRKILEDVLQYTDQVIVVNDGSTDNTLSSINAFKSIACITYQQNQGKGYAIRTGFKEALKLGYEYAITIDSDGQHFAEDLPLFLNKLEETPSSIIMGARNMDQSSVPGKSSFGNKFSNFWFWVETGKKLPDTQSGYRLYPIRLMEGMKFITRKFEFEIEVIVRAVWKGIPIHSVPVKVYYASKEERVSHFRPFIDFARISILNTVLVLIAFLYIKPRDFYREIKKKTSKRSFGSYYSVRMSQLRLKHYQSALESSWG